jgi:hypothetical protein
LGPGKNYRLSPPLYGPEKELENRSTIKTFPTKKTYLLEKVPINPEIKTWKNLLNQFH